MNSDSWTHGVVVGEPSRGFLDVGGSHSFLFDCNTNWVPESGSHQLLQFLGLGG